MSAGPRRWRAPREHGQALIVPPLAEIRITRSGIRQNSDLGASEFWRIPLREARAGLLEAALAHTRQYRDVPDAIDPIAPILMAGHQPELFHAGVWFKNFLLSSLAAKHQAIAINLIVDNDTVDKPVIRVPAGSVEMPRLETVAIDAASEGIPFEERTVLDWTLLESFDARVTQTIRPWIADPLVGQLWKHVREARSWTNNLGLLLAGARHQLEAQWGLSTLEVPLSVLAEQPAFRAWSLAWLRQADRMREIYNAALHEYRAVNRVRSRSHPVPNLANDDQWCEAPFWIWSREAPHRQRLFVRGSSEGLELTDRGAVRQVLPDEYAWAEAELRGIKIRPRALTTTMYVRLVLCDLFIHGIGGAKYDELTDAIIRRSMNVEPPTYLTATATLQLPLEYPRVSQEQVRTAQREVRELRFHAERSADASELVARKQQLLAEMPPHGARIDWHREITRVNEQLAARAAPLRDQAQQRADDLAQQQRAARLLGSREFSFCLYPADFLRILLLDLSRVTA